MADRVVGMDVRAQVVQWPQDAPRGAVSRFVREHEVSRSWFYEVRRRVVEEGALAALQPRPRRVGSARPVGAVPVAVEEIAVLIRKQLHDDGWDCGPVTVRHELQRRGIKAPAASTLARIFTRRGMVVPQPKKRPRSSYRRFSFAMVHECWQLDSFEWPLTDGTRVAVFQLLDDHSRFLLASWVGPGERAADAIAVVDLGISRFQVPVLLLTDNGSAFNQTRVGRRTQLVDHLAARGCRSITGRPGHPQTQGKDERVHATLQRWLRRQPPAASIAELTAQIAVFDEYYNHRRPHQSLQMRTPAAVLAAAPHAIAPPPDDSTAPGSMHPVVTTHRCRVNNTGSATLDYAKFQLGAEHRGTTITAVNSGNTVAFFDPKGHLIRSQTLRPGATYYSNGRPRGRRPRTECPD
jgi:transposase InsO family protein